MKHTSRMLRIIIALSVAALFLVACATVRHTETPQVQIPEPHPSPVAHLILSNGQIYTEADTAEAIAIDENGIIVAVGKSESIIAMANEETDLIDLKGDIVLPGFHDLHVHPIFAGLQAQRCVIAQGSDLKQVLEQVKSCVEEANLGGWITGGQWDASALGEVPNRLMLDAFSPNNPVLLGDTSEHSGWANSEALEIAGVNKETPDPEGGIIERDDSGNPTGILRETAYGLVKQHVPEATDNQVRSALQWGLDQMLSYGVTSLTEAAVGYSSNVVKEVKAYADLAEEGIIKQRIRVCLPWAPDNKELEAIITSRAEYVRDRVCLDCVKIFLDGVPTDSHTAAMLEPYEGTVEGRDDEASRYGLLMIEQSALDEAITRFDAMGLTVKFHSAGDAAVRAGLKAIESARKSNGDSGLRHNPGHCTFIAKDDIPWARDLGATLELSPYLWSPSPINDDITAAAGKERIKRVWPFREAIDSGALVVPGSDWSVVPSVNPWVAIEALVTRERPGGSSDSFGKEQAITLEEAVELFTVNSAKHMGTEERLGRIAPGTMADLIVIDRNPYEIPITEVHKIIVKKTIINGEVVYDRAGNE